MDEYINKLRDNPAFLEFEAKVLEEIEELDTVMDLDKMDDKSAGEEAKARAKARKIVIKIFSPFINFAEKVAPTKEQIDEVKKKNLL